MLTRFTVHLKWNSLRAKRCLRVEHRSTRAVQAAIHTTGGGEWRKEVAPCEFRWDRVRETGSGG